jgi:hypothetical protein
MDNEIVLDISPPKNGINSGNKKIKSKNNGAIFVCGGERNHVAFVFSNFFLGCLIPPIYLPLIACTQPNIFLFLNRKKHRCAYSFI